ncbi:MAG: DoxX family protein [Gammaproteobacteria bacterium]|jgi:putative oxidoreductase|nr:DoxX family protein [Gammaproteobacteria bacterium]MBT5202576.1 DoxX family protein [Gammaproteobacteria bacterium]MBT5602454.1 DoxX family protein [Gammaproteobacteria bacterium]MBT6243776.1 DoxX family protein [Gammaproteobacteria bacterium]
MLNLQKTCAFSGRVLLGLYFLIPGISKITGFEATSVYMAEHGMVLIPFFLVLTIILQVGGGICLILGFRIHENALMFAALTLVISLVMHDFWNLESGIQQAHETQNFVKNMAIMAGLLALSASRYVTAWSLNKQKSEPQS